MVPNLNNNIVVIFLILFCYLIDFDFFVSKKKLKKKALFALSNFYFVLFSKKYLK